MEQLLGRVKVALTAPAIHVHRRMIEPLRFARGFPIDVFMQAWAVLAMCPMLTSVEIDMSVREPVSFVDFYAADDKRALVKQYGHHLVHLASFWLLAVGGRWETVLQDIAQGAHTDENISDNVADAVANMLCELTHVFNDYVMMWTQHIFDLPLDTNVFSMPMVLVNVPCFGLGQGQCEDSGFDGSQLAEDVCLPEAVCLPKDVRLADTPSESTSIESTSMPPEELNSYLQQLRELQQQAEAQEEPETREATEDERERARLVFRDVARGNEASDDFTMKGVHLTPDDVRLTHMGKCGRHKNIHVVKAVLQLRSAGFNVDMSSDVAKHVVENNRPLLTMFMNMCRNANLRQLLGALGKQNDWRVIGEHNEGFRPRPTVAEFIEYLCTVRDTHMPRVSIDETLRIFHSVHLDLLRVREDRRAQRQRADAMNRGAMLW